ncbi:hypothetical protein H4R99_008099 [Coemansia sp. RSA 1722]|nr:hypothetical protein IWW45_007044 [Coemansia sp. RSA 485]KAJ2587576.1 hypothetical protein H4R99_008099 [Coemansia sp. RSA 1722]
MGSKQESTDTDGFKVPLLPASKLKPDRPSSNTPEYFPPLKYTPPKDASVPKYRYTLEVIKDGQVIEEHDIGLDKTFFTFGRLPICDFPMEHGSISRYHAVLQFTDSGSAYIYDLSSSHGTLVNKTPVNAGAPRKIQIGDQIRFGVSSRIWVMDTSDDQLIDAQEAERQVQDADTTGSDTRQTQAKVSTGGAEIRLASWADDDIDEAGSTENTQWKRNPDAAYRRDPIKYLREFLTEMDHLYEPEIQTKDDEDIDSEFTERKQTKSRDIKVRIALPVDGIGAKPLYGIGQSLKKKEAERLACLDALEELDKNGYLNLEEDRKQSRRAKKQAMKHKSDDEFEDQFFDRTKPTNKRKLEDKPETFETLSIKLEATKQDIEQIQSHFDKLQADAATAESNADNAQDDGDELDAYMNALEKGEQASTKKQMVGRLAELEKEKTRLLALIKLVAPEEAVVIRECSHHETQTKRVESQETAPGQPEPKRQRKSHGPTLQQIVTSQKEIKEESQNQDRNQKSEQDRPSIQQSSETLEWQPPAGQTGDGRTSLNDKLGY